MMYFVNTLLYRDCTHIDNIALSVFVMYQFENIVLLVFVRAGSQINVLTLFLSIDFIC